LFTPIAKIAKQSASSFKKETVPEHLVSDIISFGFTRSQAEGSLRKCDNNMERAVDYLLTHPEDNFEPTSDEMQVDKVGNLIIEKDINTNNSSVYDLYAFITHLGKNTSHGHYVSHIKKGNDWIYFNDSKVNIDSDPPIHKGYIYFYKNY